MLELNPIDPDKYVISHLNKCSKDVDQSITNKLEHAIYTDEFNASGVLNKVVKNCIKKKKQFSELARN